MNRSLLAVALTLGACAPPVRVPATVSPSEKTLPALTYPATRADPTSDTLFGTRVEDPYRWLEDAGSDAVKSWMTEQDRLARDQLAALPGRDTLLARLRALFYLESVSVPRLRGARYFYSRTHPDREKAMVYWREGAGDEHLLLDPNTMSSDGTTSLGLYAPSRSGAHVAYTIHRNNSDEATLHLIDVGSGAVSEIDTIPGAKYAAPSWTPEGDGFYYTWLPSDPAIPVADRPGFAEIRFHRLGAAPATDAIIHERTGNPQTFVGADLSRDGHWLLFYVQHGWDATDVYFRDARQKSDPWRPLTVGVAAQFRVEAWRDRFYITTNDGAPRWRVLRADPTHPERAAWQEIIAESSDAVLDGADVIGGVLALNYTRNASSALELRTLDGALLRQVALPGIGSSGGISGNPDQDEAYFAFNSFTQPPQIFRTSIATGATALWAAVKVPIDPSPFTVEQAWYPSKDGTRISMFIVHKKGLPRDGSTPFLLTGYGGFNVSMLPTFSAGIYPWLEAGGGYAVPNLRGGAEYGEDWHKAGKGEHKQNVFDDFIAAAEFLIAKGYTRADRLALRGGSNGGLLVGAALTQRPSLFRAVICQVPLLDMVRYHLFGSGKTWIPEYGSADDEAGFRTLFGYSPYHHVARAAYPSVLMMSADADDRVDPLHARKMAAALQARSTSGRPVLLRIERHAGHTGADQVKQAVESGADAYGFLMHELGMIPRR